MQHIAVKSNLVETTTTETNLVFGENNVPLCPKPRRAGIPPLPEFLNSLGGCNNHRYYYYYSFIHSFTKSQNVTFLLCSSLSDHCSLNPNVISQVHNDGRSEILNMITEKV